MGSISKSFLDVILYILFIDVRLVRATLPAPIISANNPNDIDMTIFSRPIRHYT